ncbi:FtsX-like permease family protein [Actinomadura xylanilytica]|uniref:FtsX-like permease family protein n=1 Tax=Actinomadura xylanilytica TaxID=887459 RepID=UPI00255B218D|nr:FtsX-like permease family protein [Actinomadura xylanilytica]MDL4772562.1 FtsX-like permease family protein [Actinomadura xylanilytica]
MRQSGLVIRRMAGDRTLVLAACATALFATTVLAALVGYAGTVTREGLRRTLAGASFETSGTRIAASVPAGGFDTARGQIDQALRQIYRDVPLTVSTAVRSDSFTLPGQEDEGHPELTAFASYDGIEGHARLAQGRWPAAAPAAGRDAALEATLPAAAARSLRVGVGDTLTMHGRVDRASTAKVTVVGLFEVPRPDEYFWQGDRLVTTGTERLDYTTYGPFVVRPEAFAARFTAAGTGSGTEIRWTVLPDMRGVEAGDLKGLGQRVRDGGAVFTKAGGGSTRFTATTALPDLLAQVDGAVLVARSTMLMPVLQLVLLAAYAWLLVARLLADHRRTEVALLRTRGVGIRQLAGISLTEGLLTVLPAAVFGPLLAGPLLRVAGLAPAVRASGLSLDAGPLAPLWAVSVTTALVCAVVSIVPTLRGANRTFVEAQTSIGRSRRGGLKGSGADLALLVVAGLGIWQLTRYGGAASTSGTGSDGAASGIDPFIVSGPALALLAGGVLLLRLVPVASSTAERAASRGRGLAPVLGARQVSRRQLRYAGPALLLVMAMAVGVLSVTTMATWRRSQSDQAAFQSAADLRLAAPSAPGGPATLGLGGRFAALPGVTAATAVVRKDATVGNGPAILLAADAKALGPILRVRPDLLRGMDLGRLAAARPAVPVAPVPGRPERLLFDLRLKAAPGETAPAGAFQAKAIIEDARGLTHTAPLTGLAVDGRTHTAEVDTAGLAGPGGVLSHPLSIRGLQYGYDDNPTSGALTLDLLKMRGEGGTGAGEVRMPHGTGWDVFAPNLRKAPTAGRGEGPLSVSLSATPATFERGGSGAVVNALLTAGTAPKHGGQAANARLLPVVPAVVTEKLASRVHVGVGGTTTLATGDGDQPVKVTAVVRALPSTPPDQPAALVDLPTLAERRIAAGSAGPESVRPAEWWASVRGERTAPAVRELAAHSAWGTAEGDRIALRDELRDAPLGAALQGALMLGFGAALAFAVIAFVVNAAVSVRERTREFTVLRTLGVRSGQLAGMLAVEQAFLVVLGLAGGLVLGLVVAQLVVPDIVLNVQAAPSYPPADLVVRWPLVLAMLAGVAAILGLVLLLLIRVLRRRGLTAGLRAGEDR